MEPALTFAYASRSVEAWGWGSDFKLQAAARELVEDDVGQHDHWVGTVPHVPPAELEDILYNAGYTEGAGAQIYGAVIVTSGTQSQRSLQLVDMVIPACSIFWVSIA